MKAVISIGNPLKSDDNIGNIILDMIDVDAMKIKCETTPENFLESLKGYDEIIILDALQFDGYVGQVEAFELEDVEDRITSTHSLPVALFKRFFPEAKIEIIGIQTKSIDFGEELSSELKDRLGNIAKDVEKLINSL